MLLRLLLLAAIGLVATALPMPPSKIANPMSPELPPNSTMIKDIIEKFKEDWIRHRPTTAPSKIGNPISPELPCPNSTAIKHIIEWLEEERTRHPPTTAPSEMNNVIPYPPQMLRLAPVPY